MREQACITDCSNLISEWDWKKNNEISLDPANISCRSNKMAWWICSNNHSWKDTIGHRFAGRGCPYCSNHRLLVGYNDLSTRNPKLAEEWHPNNNGKLTPKDVFASANKKVWWLCSAGHSWQDTVNHRNSGRKCPYCSGKRVLAGYNDLNTVNPVLASEWHPTRNGELTPREVTANSSRKVWWKCIVGHEWEAVISSRNRGNGCPICDKEKKTSFPEQAVYFYIKKVFPDSVSRYICEGNELDVYIPSQRIGIEYDGMRFHTESSLGREQNKDLFFAQNGIIVIRLKERYDLSDKICTDNTFIYYDTHSNYRYLPNAIEYLINMIAKLIKTNVTTPPIDLQKDASAIYQLYLSDIKEKSIISNYILAEEWNFEKNGSLNPAYILLNARKRVWWKCRLGHEWQAVVASRSAGCGCPYCANQKVFPGFNDLMTKNPKLASEWHPTKNGNLNPDSIMPGTAKTVWWLCDKGHEWQATVNDRTNGNGCPYCSNKKVVPGENDLLSNNPSLASEWHPTKNDDLMPYMFTCRSGKVVWWLCKSGHEWQASIYHRNNGSGCPFCYNEIRKSRNAKKINVYNATDLSYYGTFDSSRTLCEHLGIDYQKQMGNIAAVCRRAQKTLMRRYVLRYSYDDEFTGND